MNILIIDNFDSFTFNLNHYVSEFVENCVVVRSDKLSEIEFVNFDKIILSPGPSLPQNHTNLFKILKNYSESKSIFGICLGMQAITEFFGGKLKNLQKVKHGVSSRNRVVMKDNLYKGILQNLKLVIITLGLWIRKITPCFYITSMNEDGLIMSISHKNLDIRGVQFHPESVLTNYGKKLIKNWLFS